MTATEYNTQKALGLMGKYKLRIEVNVGTNTQTVKKVVASHTSISFMRTVKNSRAEGYKVNFYNSITFIFEVKCTHNTAQIMTNITEELNKCYCPHLIAMQEISNDC